MMKNPKNANGWAAMISQAMEKHPEPVPEGFKRVEEISTLTGKSVSMTRLYIRKLESEGLLEARRFVVRSGTRVYPVMHYKIK